MSCISRTGWFPADQKPVRTGVYERKHITWGVCYQYYNGKGWCFPAYTVEGAFRNRREVSQDQISPWRGLSEPPQ